MLENRTKLPSGNTCHLEMNRFIYRLINLYKVLKKRHQHGVSVTYGNRNEQIHFTNGIVMLVCACKNLKWETGKSTRKYTRIDGFLEILFDAIYTKNFQQITFVIDDGKVDVNIKDDYGDTQLMTVCQQETLQNEEEAVPRSKCRMIQEIQP